MWDTVLPRSSCSYEPEQLRMLKQELGHLTCKCNMCVTFKDPLLYHRSNQNDEAVQVQQDNALLNKYIYATSDTPPVFSEHSTNFFSKNVFCPNCNFIWDLLMRTTKVFKDNEAEIKPESSDKSTDKSVNYIDSTTSVTKKPVLNQPSNMSLCDDYISDCSSKSSLNNLIKRKHIDRVTFLDDYHNMENEKEPASITLKVGCKKDPQNFVLKGNCLCLENFMDSIRPPLNNIL